MPNRQQVHSPHPVHAAVEIGSQGAEKVAGGLKTAKAIAASEAFRKYSWLRNAPIKNVSGNFRGMVISRKWAAVFHFSEEILKPVEKVAIVAALAENLTDGDNIYLFVNHYLVIR